MPHATPPSDDRSLAGTSVEMSSWSWDVQAGTVSWSAGIEQALFGLPAGGFAGTFEAYLALVHPDDRAHFLAVVDRVLKGEDE